MGIVTEDLRTMRKGTFDETILTKITKNVKKIRQIYQKKKQPTHLLEVVQSPVVMEKLCNYLDVRSISKLEQCCHLLRDLVAENRIYRRKVSAAIRGGGQNTGGWLRKSVTDPTDLEMSNFFKKNYYKTPRPCPPLRLIPALTVG